MDDIYSENSTLDKQVTPHCICIFVFIKCNSSFHSNPHKSNSDPYFNVILNWNIKFHCKDFFFFFTFRKPWKGKKVAKMDSWTLRSLSIICMIMRKTWNLSWKASTGRMQVLNQNFYFLTDVLVVVTVSSFTYNLRYPFLIMHLFPFKAVLILRSSCSLFVNLVFIFPQSM